ncbi:MAG TPA: hypothetical protein ENJ82_18305 [Bacteroidetes bacterium]|nr:hypothetical protein [Bacteroidota bacterium]
MIKYQSIFAAGFLTLLLCFSCSYNNVEDLEREAFPNPCDTIVASFAADIQPILTRYCANATFNPGGSCHEAGSPIVDFTIYSGVNSKVGSGSFGQRTLTERSMPPVYSTGPHMLDSCEFVILKNWVDAGALDN